MEILLPVQAALGIKSNDKESAWEKEMGYDLDPHQKPAAKRARPQQLSFKRFKRAGTQVARPLLLLLYYSQAYS